MTLMRITEGARFGSSRQRLETGRSRIARAQEQLTSGLRVNRPSDDPTGAMRIREIRSDLRRVGQFERNISRAQSSLMHADSVVGEVSTAMMRVKELTLQGATSALTDEDARTITEEIRLLLDHVRTLANARTGGRYLFGGYRSDAEPFDENFVYRGDDHATEIEIGDRHHVEFALPGSRIFVSDPGNPDRVDVFEVIADAIDAINTRNENDIEASVEEVERAIEQIIDARTEVGVRQAAVEAALSVNDALKATLPEDLRALQDTDFAQAVSELTLAETAFEATLAVDARRMSGVSLLDFMR